MKLLLIQILFTCLLTGCAGGWTWEDIFEVSDDLAELHEINCANGSKGKGCEIYKEPEEPAKKKNKCRYRGETDCYTNFSNENE